MDFQTGTLLVGMFLVATGLIWLNVKIKKERDNG